MAADGDHRAGDCGSTVPLQKATEATDVFSPPPTHNSSTEQQPWPTDAEGLRRLGFGPIPSAPPSDEGASHADGAEHAAPATPAPVGTLPAAHFPLPPHILARGETGSSPAVPPTQPARKDNATPPAAVTSQAVSAAGRYDDTVAYKVGKGKPPLHTRFQKG